MRGIQGFKKTVRNFGVALHNSPFPKRICLTSVTSSTTSPSRGMTIFLTVAAFAAMVALMPHGLPLKGDEASHPLAGPDVTAITNLLKKLNTGVQEQPDLDGHGKDDTLEGTWAEEPVADLEKPADGPVPNPVSVQSDEMEVLSKLEMEDPASYSDILIVLGCALVVVLVSIWYACVAVLLYKRFLRLPLTPA